VSALARCTHRLAAQQFWSTDQKYRSKDRALPRGVLPPIAFFLMAKLTDY
jgi:hypothetical protein